MSKKTNQPITTSAYWDCECEKDYIHPKNQNKCKKCGAIREESPDSTIKEVFKYIPTIERFDLQAVKVIELINTFDEVSKQNHKEHVKLAIMAGLSDAYRDGYKKAMLEKDK